MIYLNNTTDSQRVAVPLTTNNTEYVNFMPDKPDTPDMPNADDYYTKDEIDSKLENLDINGDVQIRTLKYQTIKNNEVITTDEDRIYNIETYEIIKAVGDDMTKMPVVYAEGWMLVPTGWSQGVVENRPYCGFVGTVKFGGVDGEVHFSLYEDGSIEQDETQAALTFLILNDGNTNSESDTMLFFTNFNTQMVNNYQPYMRVEDGVAVCDVVSPEGWVEYNDGNKRYRKTYNKSTGELISTEELVSAGGGSTGATDLYYTKTEVNERVNAVYDYTDTKTAELEAADEHLQNQITAHHVLITDIQNREEDYLTWDKLNNVDWGIDWGHVSWIWEDDWSMSLDDFFKIFERMKTGKSTIIACTNGWKSNVILNAHFTESDSIHEYNLAFIMGDVDVNNGVLNNCFLVKFYLQMDKFTGEYYSGNVYDNGDAYRIYMMGLSPLDGSAVGAGGSNATLDSLTVNGSTTLNGYTYVYGEMQFNSDGYEDISYGVQCDMKMNRAQVKSIFTKNIWNSVNGDDIVFGTYGYGDELLGVEGAKQLAKIDGQGNIYEGTAKLSDKYVLKSDYDALLARVEALEGK